MSAHRDRQQNPRTPHCLISVGDIKLINPRFPLTELSAPLSWSCSHSPGCHGSAGHRGCCLPSWAVGRDGAIGHPSTLGCCCHLVCCKHYPTGQQTWRALAGRGGAFPSLLCLQSHSHFLCPKLQSKGTWGRSSQCAHARNLDNFRGPCTPHLQMWPLSPCHCVFPEGGTPGGIERASRNPSGWFHLDHPQVGHSQTESGPELKLGWKVIKQTYTTFVT